MAEGRDLGNKKFSHKEHIEKIVGAALMWLPGAGVGGEDLTAKNAKGVKEEGTHYAGTKDTKGSDIYILKLRELRAFVVKKCQVTAFGG